MKEATRILQPVYDGASRLSVMDGPSPVGDVIGATIAGIAIVGTVVYGTIEAVKSIPKSPAISIPRDGIISIPKTPPKSTGYWLADKNANKIAPISYSVALTTVKAKGNIICDTQFNAMEVAKWFPGSYIDGPHGGAGYYRHYHISERHGPPHIWFYETLETLNSR